MSQMNKSILCKLDLHRWGKWEKGEAIVDGVPAKTEIRRCLRVNCDTWQYKDPFDKNRPFTYQE